jgi:uncharacterized NAD-dependent epimerase/dehydratase family protein
MDLETIAKWAVDLYEARTRLVAEGKASIYIVHPAYRVSWNDIVAEFPDITWLDREPFQKTYEKHMKKRGLLTVLRGKTKSDEWVLKHPK